MFYIKEVSNKKDVLKKIRIPLNLYTGKINESKLSIDKLLTLSPLVLEITGINIEVNSIYLTMDYHSNYISIKEQLLTI